MSMCMHMRSYTCMDMCRVHVRDMCVTCMPRGGERMVDEVTEEALGMAATQLGADVGDDEMAGSRVQRYSVRACARVGALSMPALPRYRPPT